MHRFRRIAALVSLCVAGKLSAQTTISNVRYDLTFNQATARTRTINLATNFDVAGAGPVLLSLPVWTPGAYEVTYFDRKVLDFSPKANNQALVWDKTSFSKYRIQSGGARHITIDYTFLADSLDNAMAWSKPDFLLVNGTNVFFYPENGPLAQPATVTVHTEPNWKVVTAMAPAGAPNTFREANYHDLVDMPFFIGALDFDSAQANGKWNRLASYPTGRMNDAARAKLLDEMGKLLAAESAVFNEMPWSVYTTMIVYDSAYGGASALEHQRAHVGVYNTGLIGNPIISSITAHEMFHAWNVKRMRPSELWPYRYGAEQPTPWLWVSEGITDYYADLAMVRSGVGSTDDFFTVTGGKLANVNSVPAVALEDASLSTWIHPVDGTGYIYYPKGSLAGFMLDIMIRDASNNRRSLDTVMREVYSAAYKAGRGFTSQDWWGAVTRAAGGRSFIDFNRKYVDGREPYPWQELLPLAGLVLRTDTIYDARLGINTGVNPQGEVIATGINPGGAAEAAGMQSGDVIVSVGTVKITDQNESFVQFRSSYAQGTPGSALPIVVKRNNQELTLQGQLRLVPRADSRIQLDPSAGEKAVRIREGILHGKVDS